MNKAGGIITIIFLTIACIFMGLTHFIEADTARIENEIESVITETELILDEPSVTYATTFPFEIDASTPNLELEIDTDSGIDPNAFCVITDAGDFVFDDVFQPMVLELSTEDNAVLINIPDADELYKYVSGGIELTGRAQIIIRIGDADYTLIFPINPPEAVEINADIYDNSNIYGDLP
jgi:hypothetical protein